MRQRQWIDIRLFRIFFALVVNKFLVLLLMNWSRESLLYQFGVMLLLLTGRIRCLLTLWFAAFGSQWIPNLAMSTGSYSKVSNIWTFSMQCLQKIWRRRVHCGQVFYLKFIILVWCSVHHGCPACWAAVQEKLLAESWCWSATDLINLENRITQGRQWAWRERDFDGGCCELRSGFFTHLRW